MKILAHGNSIKFINDWRNDPVTEKQKQMIAGMQETAGMNGAIIPEFTGKTKVEAIDYISKYINECYQSAYNPHENAGDRI